jgi:transcriptional regulator with XRE-family HTH domain
MSRAATIRDTAIYKRFRENVRDELASQERTQKSLAAEIGITNVQLCNILTGKSDPTLSMCTRIAKALGVPVTVFLVG